MREFNLVSAPFASGIAWPVNILLALGIRATHVSPRYSDGSWVVTPGSPGVESLAPEAWELLRWHLPVVLERRNRFRLAPGIEVYWEHRLDFARRAERPTLVFVRDPRDAIYSLYRRHHEKSLSFLAYLRRPDVFPDHFPEMFGLPPAETWAAWHAMWLGLRDVMQIKFFRFEEWRAAPIEGVREMLAFLGTDRTEAEIREALECSTVEHAKAAMEQCAQATGQCRGTVRRGQVEEWRQTYTDEALRAFQGPANGIMQEIGYAPIVPADQSAPNRARLAELVTNETVRAHTTQARLACMAGHEAAAVAELRRGAEAAEKHLLARLFVANEFIAMTWVRQVFGASWPQSPAAQAAWTAFRDFNERFVAWLPIQRMLLAGLERLLNEPRQGADPPEASATRPVISPSGPPILVEADYSGFNLVRFHGRLHAVARVLGPIDLAALPQVQWDEHRRRGTLLSANQLHEVKQAVDAWQAQHPPPRPSLFGSLVWPPESPVASGTLPMFLSPPARGCLP
jgi:hypothetical protein